MSNETEKSPLIAYGLSRGMKLGQPTAADAQAEMNEHLDKALAPQSVEAAKPKKMSRARRLGLSVAAATGLAAGVAGVVAATDGFEHKPGVESLPTGEDGPTDQYIYQSGDNPDVVARKVDAAVDGVAGNQNKLPLVNDLDKQDGENPGPGTAVQISTEADLDPMKSGIQLEKPDENTPQPTLDGGTNVTRG